MTQVKDTKATLATECARRYCELVDDADEKAKAAHSAIEKLKWHKFETDLQGDALLDFFVELHGLLNDMPTRTNETGELVTSRREFVERQILELQKQGHFTWRRPSWRLIDLFTIRSEFQVEDYPVRGPVLRDVQPHYRDYLVVADAQSLECRDSGQRLLEWFTRQEVQHPGFVVLQKFMGDQAARDKATQAANTVPKPDELLDHRVCLSLTKSVRDWLDEQERERQRRIEEAQQKQQEETNYKVRQLASELQAAGDEERELVREALAAVEGARE